MNIKKFINEQVFRHHTERDLIRVSIVRGVDHCHLELRDGELAENYEYRSLDEALLKTISFLKVKL